MWNQAGRSPYLGFQSSPHRQVVTAALNSRVKRSMPPACRGLATQQQHKEQQQAVLLGLERGRAPGDLLGHRTAKGTADCTAWFTMARLAARRGQKLPMFVSAGTAQVPSAHPGPGKVLSPASQRSQIPQANACYHWSKTEPNTKPPHSS